MPFETTLLDSLMGRIDRVHDKLKFVGHWEKQ
jgi:hypothetical protein